MFIKQQPKCGLLLPLCASTALLIFVAICQADTIDPISATASSYYIGATARSPDKTIDGSGLTGNAHDSNADESMWLSDGDIDSDGKPDITWDLGAACALTGLHLWNYNPSDAAPLWRSGVNQTTILTSMTGAPGSFTALPGTFSFTAAPGANGYLGEDYTLPAITARYVTFDIISNFGGLDMYPNIIKESVGISEIRFQGTTVPEPAAISIVAALVGGASLRIRRMETR